MESTSNAKTTKKKAPRAQKQKTTNTAKPSNKNNNQIAENLCERIDKKSRTIVKQKLGDAVKDNPDKSGEDMIVVSKKIPYSHIDLQVYGKWTEDKFPYEFPFIYNKKMEFSNKTLFICFNATYDKLIMFSKSVVSLEGQKEKKGNTKKLIHFVPMVPLSNTMIITTNNLNIDIIRNYYGVYDDEEEFPK